MKLKAKKRTINDKLKLPQALEPALARVQERVQERVPVQWRPKRLGQEEPGVPWLTRFGEAEKSCNTKQDELKLRVDLPKEGEICQAWCIKDPMTASRDFEGQ